MSHIDTLDSNIRSLADELANLEVDLSPIGRRRAAVEVSRIFHLGSEHDPAHAVPSHDQVVPGDHGEAVHIRVYQPPKEGDETQPTVVYFHGGGWVAGSVETYDIDMKRLAAVTGARVISTEYRLAPEHPFPAAYDDCLKAARHALAESSGAIAIAGDSAGGGLALAVANTLADEGERLSALLLFYPALDPAATDNESYRRNGTDYLLTTADMRYYYSSYLPAGTSWSDPRAVAIAAADFRGLPNTVIATGGFDPLLEEDQELARRLVSDGVAVTYLPNPTLTHGFQQMAWRVPAAGEATDRAYLAFAQAVASANDNLTAIGTPHE